MAALKDLAESRAALLNFDPRKLKVKAGLNTRDVRTPDNEAHIEWLAQSIAEEGVKNPLTIFMENGEVFVADGHCRLAAALRAIANGASIETVPCIPEQRGTNDVDRVLSQVIQNSGKPLTPLELGANFRKAMQLGAKIEEIAQRVCKSVSYVSQMIDFQGAPQEVHEMVRNGEVSATLAAKVHRERGTDAAVILRGAVKAARDNGQAKATEKHVAPRDQVWSRVQKIAKQAKRPDGVSDQDLYEVLTLLGEP